MIQKNWQELIKPNKLEVTAGDGRSKRRVATLVAEPLERGFGTTLGNSLRRVLLSSLQGAAITSVQIDGVLHEFSSIPGVREDVTDIVLNIKTIADQDAGRRRQAPDAAQVRPRRLVTAGDIQTTGDIQVLNPEPRDLHPRRGRGNPHGVHGFDDRQGLRPGRPQPPRGRADRPHPGRQPCSRR